MECLLRNDQRASLPWALETLRQEGGVLLGDAPGFGKSFQALGLAQALGARVSILGPRALETMWRDYLSRFGIEGKFYSLGELRHRSTPPVTVLDRSSILIVDEAHAFVQPHSQQSEGLARWCYGIPTILLSATPFQNHPRDVLQLLSYFSLEAQWLCARREYSSARSLALIDRLSVRRDVVHHRKVTRTRYSVEAPVVALEEAAKQMAWAQTSHRALFFQHLLQRSLSSPSAGRASLARAIRYLEEQKAHQDAGYDLSRKAFASDFIGGQRAFPFWHGEAFASAEDKDASLGERIEVLLRIQQELPAVSEQEHFSWLRRLSPPVLVFSQFRTTIDALWRAFRHERPLIRWTGEGIETNFAWRGTQEELRHPQAWTLATDVASQGLDFQHAASLVHLDLHWNPMNTLQREGRALRGTTTDPLHIWSPEYSTEVQKAWRLGALREEKLDRHRRWHNAQTRAIQSPATTVSLRTKSPATDHSPLEGPFIENGLHKAGLLEEISDLRGAILRLLSEAPSLLQAAESFSSHGMSAHTKDLARQQGLWPAGLQHWSHDDVRAAHPKESDQRLKHWHQQLHRALETRDTPLPYTPETIIAAPRRTQGERLV